MGRGLKRILFLYHRLNMPILKASSISFVHNQVPTYKCYEAHKLHPDLANLLVDLSCRMISEYEIKSRNLTYELI